MSRARSPWLRTLFPSGLGAGTQDACSLHADDPSGRLAWAQVEGFAADSDAPLSRNIARVLAVAVTQALCLNADRISLLCRKPHPEADLPSRLVRSVVSNTLTARLREVPGASPALSWAAAGLLVPAEIDEVLLFAVGPRAVTLSISGGSRGTARLGYVPGAAPLSLALAPDVRVLRCAAPLRLIEAAVLAVSGPAGAPDSFWGSQGDAPPGSRAAEALAELTRCGPQFIARRASLPRRTRKTSP